MHVTTRTGVASLFAVLAMSAPVAVMAQQDNGDANIVVTGVALPKGPDIKGIISARNDEKLKIVADDGTATVVTINDGTRIRAGGGLFSGKSKRGSEALLNGLPVTVKTVQGSEGLIASQISFRNGDFKTATMIHNGTDQRFVRNEAATEALRSRVGDIDKYNIKRTTNVYFDTGKWQLTPQSKAELCSTATEAQSTDNSLMLVLGYTDDVGDEDYNQTLSEKRASAVINHLQQQCRWAPYRVLTPAGMAESDPAADNTTDAGRAQNRRVSVNVLVSKAVDVDDGTQLSMR